MNKTHSYRKIKPLSKTLKPYKGSLLNKLKQNIFYSCTLFIHNPCSI